jgi:hypothetical protein
VHHRLARHTMTCGMCTETFEPNMCRLQSPTKFRHFALVPIMMNACALCSNHILIYGYKYLPPYYYSPTSQHLHFCSISCFDVYFSARDPCVVCGRFSIFGEYKTTPCGFRVCAWPSKCEHECKCNHKFTIQ